MSSLINDHIPSGFIMGLFAENQEVVKQYLMNLPHTQLPDNDNEAIKTACCFGFTDVAKEMLDRPGVDPSADDSYAIRVAAWKNHPETVALLLKDGRSNPFHWYEAPLRFTAARFGNCPEVTKLILAEKEKYSSLEIWNFSNTANIEMPMYILEEKSSKNYGKV